ncbi:MAG: carboxypeptidase M32 [Spirochaetota bacterium]
MKKALEQLKKLDAEIKTLRGARAALEWDQHVYMPERGVHGRSEQAAVIESIIHQKETNPQIGELLDKLDVSDKNPLGSQELSEDHRRLVRAIHRDFKQLTRLPAELVERRARVTSVAQSVWAEARKKGDFELFKPHLEQIVDMSIETAERLGYQAHPYDALVDLYEPDMSSAEIGRVFRELREGLVPLVRRISEARQVDRTVLDRRFPAQGQERFGRKVLEAMGFDMRRGRLDASVHPFTISLGGDDVRLTTRYDETYFPTALFGIIHEAGHGLYELGFRRDYHGSRLADAASLGIHESMSRFWENVVGRSRAFWHHFYPIMKQEFGDELSGIDLEQFYKAVNLVEPSHIRVEADEVTYSLHIVLRFELERMLLGKELSVGDLPEAWREQSRDLLGIVPHNVSEGVLQDIHWSGGAIGYFPTYALGNLYGLQFVSRMRSDMPDMDTRIRNGELLPIKAWLDEHVHGPGASMTPAELCEQITGEPMSARYFLDYLNAKYADIYDL